MIARLEKEKEHARSCDATPSISIIFRCTDLRGDVLFVDLD